MTGGWQRLSLVSTQMATSWPPGAPLIVLLLYSFSSTFIPIEPYLVPYLTSVKQFSNFQVTIDIYPISIYAQLAFTFFLAPACYYLSHKIVIVLGTFAMLITYITVWSGNSLLAMQIMQITYGFGLSARLAFSSYIFLLVHADNYQKMTSLTATVSLLSFMLASELSQFLALEEVSYDIFFVISLTAQGFCCFMSFLLPNDRPTSSLSSSTSLWGQNEGLLYMVKETWRGPSLQLLSLWWAIAFAGFSLVQNYGTNLFDAVRPQSKYNGHILAASQAAGSIGSYCAIHIESLANKSGTTTYILGSALMGILCLFMGVSGKLWVIYSMYIVFCGIYQSLACLVSVRCGGLLSNGQFIVLFSFNSIAGFLIETLLQAAIEIHGLSIFAQFISYAVFFFLATVLFVGLLIVVDSKRSDLSTGLKSKVADKLLMNDAI